MEVDGIMIRDDIVAALRSVEMPPEIRARVPYGELAEAVQPVLLDATERAVLAWEKEYARLRLEGGWTT